MKTSPTPSKPETAKATPELQTSTVATVSVDLDADPKLDGLPNDPLLKGFLGMGENEPFFAREENESLPSKPIGASLLTTQKTAAESKPTILEKTTSAPASSSSSSSSAQPATLLPKSSPPFAEVIREEEAPSNFPMIDLAPFASNSGPDRSKQRVVAATKVDSSFGSSSPLPTTTSSPSTSTSRSSTSAAPATTTPAAAAAAAATQTVATASNQTSSSGSANKTTTGKPPKSFLEKADDFIGRNILNLKKLF